MNLNEALIKVIEDEVSYQSSENARQNDRYRRQSVFHTDLVAYLSESAVLYPHFISAILEHHINDELPVFGLEVYESTLTDDEQGRIYSLVRCQHMLRVAKERMNG